VRPVQRQGEKSKGERVIECREGAQRNKLGPPATRGEVGLSTAMPTRTLQLTYFDVKQRIS